MEELPARRGQLYAEADDGVLRGMRFGGLLVAAILVVGLGGTALALHSREQSDGEFVSQQQSLAPVAAGALERLIVTTRDPRPGYDHSPARAVGARCSSHTASALGNPWSCVVRYPRLPRVRYRVIVRADRSIFGSGQPEGRPLLGVLTVRGCCVASGGEA